MPTVISAFEKTHEAERAARRLVEAGFAAEDVHLHQDGVPSSNAAGVKLDEYATGGFVRNMETLLENLFKTSKPPRQADSYIDVVKQELVGLTVSAATEADASRAEALLGKVGATDVARDPAAQTPPAR